MTNYIRNEKLWYLKRGMVGPFAVGAEGWPTMKQQPVKGLLKKGLLKICKYKVGSFFGRGRFTLLETTEKGREYVKKYSNDRS